MNARQRRRQRRQYRDEIVHCRALAAMGMWPYVRMVKWAQWRLAWGFGSLLADDYLIKAIRERQIWGDWPPEPRPHESSFADVLVFHPNRLVELNTGGASPMCSSKNEE